MCSLLTLLGCAVPARQSVSERTMKYPKALDVSVKLADVFAANPYWGCSGKSTDAVAQDRFDGVGGVDAVRGWGTMRKYGVQGDCRARSSGARTSYRTAARRRCSPHGAF